MFRTNLCVLCSAVNMGLLRILLVSFFLMLTQQILSGCAIMASRDIYNEDARSNAKCIFQDKCSKCHELPVIDAYPYSPEDWAKLVDAMLQVKEAEQFMSIEDAEIIKGHIRNYLECKIKDFDKGGCFSLCDKL